MTSRTKIQLGLTAVVTTIALGVAACAVQPFGRTEYCYWYPVSTTTTSTTAPASPDTTLVCLDAQLDLTTTTEGSSTTFGTPSTLVGYPAPIPAGTRVVK
jgi:hypothetical protein